ncbi:hypothetical protein HWV62_17174 [Athelia sp. TMB]|nr:hypothetical protein HWV62_17174 [Athelia sp. TMB]
MLFKPQDLNSLAVEDPLGIVYVIETSQQFWSELEDVVHFSNENTPTLSLLDSSLKRFMTLCASYHEQYLQSPFQLEHACELLLDSELFVFHSERMCEILTDEAQSTTDPHFQLILYNVFLYYGRRKQKFLRHSKRWQLVIPLLMDHILVEIEPGVEDMYLGGGSRGVIGGSTNDHDGNASFMIPIEAKLRSLGVKLLYEVCRVQKMSMQELRVFSDAFVDHLFELVEQTREMEDETFNYSVIKLIVALNEQFMVASLGNNTVSSDHSTPEGNNRVLHVLMRRLGASKTFGENMIFMLNRANRTAEDLCMQLLVLKILYLLFTTKGTSEYFYTNDLCVLVDVFLRELVDLDEDSESLRHTYLRVLHPLLTKTQLRDIPYKRAQVVVALESLMQNAQIRDIDPTTKRLVERCLSGDWCVQLRKAKAKAPEDAHARVGSPGIDSVLATSAQQSLNLGPSASESTPHVHLERQPSGKKKTLSLTLKPSKSVENLKAKSKPPRPPRSAMENLRRPSNESASSLPGVASATTLAGAPSKRREREPPRSANIDASFAQAQGSGYVHRHNQAQWPVRADSLDGLSPTHLVPVMSLSGPSSSSVELVETQTTNSPTKRRPPPAAPPKRRKPPAIPSAVPRVERTNSGAIITSIASSTSAPNMVHKTVRATGP